MQPNLTLTKVCKRSIIIPSGLESKVGLGEAMMTLCALRKLPWGLVMSVPELRLHPSWGLSHTLFHQPAACGCSLFITSKIKKITLIADFHVLVSFKESFL